METQHIEVKDIRKRDWHRHSLSESTFTNNIISIDSDDVRNCNNIIELKAVSRFLNSHILEISKKKRTVGVCKYYFTQRSLLSQVEWAIFKINKKKQNIKDNG